jgi:Ribonuclease G/E
VAGNIYLAIARNVLPGMEAAFLDFGASKNGVLYASDVKVGTSQRGEEGPSGSKRCSRRATRSSSR